MTLSRPFTIGVAILWVLQPIAAAASSFNPSLLVNTETFQTIDDANTTADLYVRFGDSLNKRLTFERTLDRFNFNDDVYVQGGLSVSGTASGSIVHAQSQLRSSGSLTVEGASLFEGDLTFGDAIGDTVTVNAGSWTFANDTNLALTGGVNGLSIDTDTLSIDAANDRVGIGTTSPNNKLTVTGSADISTVLRVGANSGGGSTPGDIVSRRSATTGAFYFGDSSMNYLYFDGTNYLFGLGGLAVKTDGNVGVGTTAPDSKLEVVGTASGTDVYATRSLRSSGSLVWEGSASGANLWASTFDGAGLTDCDLSTNKVIWDSTAKRFACGTDLNTGSSYTAGQGLTLNGSVFRLSDSFSGTTIKATGTMSGASVFGYNLVNSQSATSGSVLVSRTTGVSEWKSPTGAMIWYIDGSLVTGTGKGAKVVMPYGMTLTDVDMRVDTAPTGAALIVDLNENGTTLFSTRPQISAGATSEAGTHAFSDTVLAAGSEVTLDIDQIGSSTPGADLTVILKGVRSY